MHYDAARFDGRPRTENHFDWDLYYRFKDQRERFWRERVDSDSAMLARASEHLSAFQRSVATTLRLLAGVKEPLVLDVGLSSEQLDRAILTKTQGQVVVLDVQAEAARSYEGAFGGRGTFVLGDVITFARDATHGGAYDLVYSIGLLEHFPDKSDILAAHIRLAKPGGLVLIYVPIDTEANRALTGMAADWENFGYRELLTPEELGRACADPALEILQIEAVGFFAAVWARKQVLPHV